MTTTKQVFGVIGDEGWIIERLAAEIAGTCPDFTYGTRIEGRPDIVYYMTYAARKQPFDGVEIGYFTHVEEGLPAEQRFYDTAAQMDHCVTQATRYERLLRARGVEDVTTIPPGIDHDEFFPRLRVGVVGRTYHTGRKGEALVAALMDMPDIEFVFTGDGWPGPARHVPQGEMGAFYRTLDYVLVPSLYEGGPMCVPEALACGTPVIAPSDVGWVEDFPHIAFPKGDAEALRRVLADFAAQKARTAEAAAGHTWRRWGDAHAELFERVGRARAAGPRTRHAAPRSRLSASRVVQVMHGNERRSMGGPSVRVPHTAERLASFAKSSTLAFGASEAGPADIAHFYNIWQPQSALALSGALARKARLRVFSPILLDLSLEPFWRGDLPAEVLSEAPGPDRMARALPRLRRMYRIAREGRDLAIRGHQPVRGFASKLAEIGRQADQLVFLSRFERALARELGMEAGRETILHNPVDCDFFTPGPAEDEAPGLGAEMRHRAGLSPDDRFLLAVGRIEVRKNQLVAAEIARRSGMILVIAGHEGARDYAEAVREVGGDRVRMIGRVAPHSPELRWLYRNCAAFLSHSWAEGASLSALEAAASGAPMLLADLSSEGEYLEGLARFCGPLDVEESLETLSSLVRDHPPGARAERHRAVRARFGWDVHVERLAAIYEDLLGAREGH